MIDLSNYKTLDLVEIDCFNCKSKFNRLKRDIVRNRSRKRENFCSRICAIYFNAKVRKIYRYCLNCDKQTYNPKYCSLQCQADYQLDLRIRSNTASTKTLKLFLIKKYGHKCWKCENSIWNELPITLELEHKDGNSDNNKFDNLEILCPNCHSQTSTYKAKNKGKGRFSRRQRYKEGKSF